MAGKSTVLRSTAAVALLAAAGLHAPARSATIPYIDAFMLRNFSADSPLEGKSSFAVEMTEMRWVLLSTAGPKSNGIRAGCGLLSVHPCQSPHVTSVHVERVVPDMNCRYVLEDATADSLVLVDELGKGTEVRAGAAIAASVLEALDATGCKVCCSRTS
jgi:DNA mismatch repair ATPase MutS